MGFHTQYIFLNRSVATLEYTNFSAMTPSEAGVYLNQFLGEMELSLDIIDKLMDSGRTFAPESLVPVWEAASARLAWRAGYKPPAQGQPGPRINGERLEPAQELPSWFHHPSGAGYARFSAETLWLIDGTARYLGETIVRNKTGCRWAMGDARAKGYMLQNQPVIVGITPFPVSPMQTCSVLVSRALESSVEVGPRTLDDVYGIWCSHVE